MPPAIGTSRTATDEVHYPASDGKPLGETSWHVESTLTLLAMLKRHLAGRRAFVASNMFLYYEQGNPRANRAPDCMVILGVEPHHRRTFKTWTEGAVPSVIFEFSSDETFDEDLNAKRALYERLRVAEYFLFDPKGDCLDPRLQGFRLDAAGRYAPLVPDADGALVSEQLGLRLVPEDELLRPIDLATGQRLMTDEELAAELEGKAAELRGKAAELEGKAAELEVQRQRTEEERRRAEALAAEVERLRALLEGRGE